MPVKPKRKTSIGGADTAITITLDDVLNALERHDAPQLFGAGTCGRP